MMEVFTFEMSHMLEQLEQIVIEAENSYTADQINEIFRIMHTIKGSAAMMLFNNIAAAGHAIEDLFYYLREKHPKNINNSKLTDHVLESMDFLKDELTKIQAGSDSDGDPTGVSVKITEFLAEIKAANNDGPPVKAAAPAAEPEPAAPVAETTAAQPVEESESVSFGFSTDNLRVFNATVTFQDGCEMENVRAYTLLYNLKNLVHDVTHEPEDLIDESTIEIIRKSGFHMEITTDKDYDDLMNILSGTVYAKDIVLNELDLSGVSAMPEAIEEKSVQAPQAEAVAEQPAPAPKPAEKDPRAEDTLMKQMAEKALESEAGTVGDSSVATKKAPVQSMISVNVSKLDMLLKLVGELVIAEAMVTQNPDLEAAESQGFMFESFRKESRQLHKIIGDLQNTIMSTRMLTLSPTFFKMNRIVRDMCKQLGKEVNLEILGEDTEVDKNIIEHISDPIMHIVRNAVDHGIEPPDQRKKAGKPERGTVTLEAKTAGSDVVISVSDDGGGLDKEKILAKAQRNGLLRKSPSDYTEKEIYQFIFMPGFSTTEAVTSFSGRGVGMDVVNKNMEIVQGTTSIDSIKGEGSVITMKIPLTLAIIKGMTIKMGGEKYTIPIDAIQQSFAPKMKDMFIDPNGNEMITVYGEHLNIVKLYEFFDTPEAARDIEDGIMMIVENGDDRICLFIDELLGEQSVVVKPIPKYIKKIPGVSGCTLLGNGDISLIIEAAAFFDR